MCENVNLITAIAWNLISFAYSKIEKSLKLQEKRQNCRKMFDFPYFIQKFDRFF